MKQLFVPYELALLANRKGFTEDCMRLWECTEFFSSPILVDHSEFKKIRANDFIPAPIYQQLVDWFQKEHNLYICIFHEFYPDGVNHLWQILEYDNSNPESPRGCTGAKSSMIYGDNGEYKNDYEALSAAIIHAFKNI